MKRQQGFTLIELVVVLIILGILAAVAIPRFASLQREARIAVAQTFYNGLRTGQHLVFAKMAANGMADTAVAVGACTNLDSGNVGATQDPRTDPVSDTTADCNDPDTTARVNTAFGYPLAEPASLRALFDDLDTRWNITGGVAQLDGLTGCGVTYTQATDSARPTVTLNIGGC